MSPPSDPISLHVLDAVEWFQRRMGAEFRAHRQRDDLPVSRGSQGRILHLLPDDGARPTELATGGWITKQAIGKRVRELEALGLVRTDPDREDGRAVVVRRTAAGDRVAAQILDAIAAIERSWAEEVGEERYATFRAVLDELGADHAPALLHRGATAPIDRDAE